MSTYNLGFNPLTKWDEPSSIVYDFSSSLGWWFDCIPVSQDAQVFISFMQGVYYYMSVYPWEKMGMRAAV